MSKEDSKQALFAHTEQQLKAQGFTIERQDRARPWGGFFALNEEQAQQFADTYFDGLPVDTLKISGRLSPKILLVAPAKRLSWQYHHRRAEIWKVLQGSVGVVRSETDQESRVETFGAGAFITLRQGERHRLVGLDSWAILAEMWQHTDPENPSDEEDIVRLQDDFGR